MANTSSGVWYAFKGFNGGKAISLPVGPAGTYEADFYGFHGYSSALQARLHPNGVPGNDPLNPASDLERMQVEAWVSNAQSSGTGTAAGPVASQVPGLGTAISDSQSITNFLGDLSSGALWERVGEAAVGLILIYVALKGITGIDPIAPVKKAAKAAAIF